MIYRERNADITELIRLGMSGAEVGRMYGLSRQRVWQIASKHGHRIGNIKKELRENREKCLPKKDKLQELRFWSRVEVLSKEACWNWQGAINKITGYGHLNYNYTCISPHRYAYKYFFKEIPKGIHVAHKCDNRICCNPFHLYLMTPYENHVDAVSKGRKDEEFFQSINHVKLTDADVQEIKSKYDGTTECCRKLAEEYGVHSVWIYKIVKYDER